MSSILSIPQDFPQIPDPRQDCHVFHAKPDEGHKQMVICPEQDCEWLAYMSDLNISMVEALGVHDHALWSTRFQEFEDWQKKTNKGSKPEQEAWTWEGSSSDKWSTTSTQGSSKRGKSVPVDISKRTNPEEKGLAQRDLEELDTSMLISTRSLMSVIIVLYVQADTLHFFVLEHRSMEAKANRIGTSRSTREPSLRIVQLNIDGETW